MSAIKYLVSLIEKLAAGVALCLIVSMMTIVVTDVVLRYGFNSPLPWAYDIISLYIMPATFFLVISSAWTSNSHVNVDFFILKMPNIAQIIFHIFANILVAAILFIMIDVGYGRFMTAFERGNVIAGRIPWPTWPSYALVPFGFGLLFLRVVLEVFEGLFKLREHLAHGSTTTPRT